MSLKITRETEQSLRVADETTGDSVLLSHEEIDQIVQAKDAPRYPRGYYIIHMTPKLAAVLDRYRDITTIKDLLDTGGLTLGNFFYLGSKAPTPEPSGLYTSHVVRATGLSQQNIRVGLYGFWTMIQVEASS